MSSCACLLYAYRPLCGLPSDLHLLSDVFKEALHFYLMPAVFCSVEEGCGRVEAKEECALQSSEWRHCDKKHMHKLSWQGNVPKSAVLMKIASLMPSGAGMQDNAQFTYQPSAPPPPPPLNPVAKGTS